MRTRGRAAVSVALAAGMLATGGCMSTAVTKPAVRAVPVRKPARTDATEATVAASPAARVSAGICSAPAPQAAVAARLSADIQGALHGRSGRHAVSVYDAVTGVSCEEDGGLHFDSASIVKAIILAALLRWHQETGTQLSDWERDQAALMITQSDNDAATDLWNEVGMSRLQHFLDLAKMTQTRLGQGGYWGLTQVTAHDELLLLKLLSLPNAVLSPASRSYELGLMSQVIPSQRWGTPAGAPGDVTVHVKNGWLPDATGWHIDSLGVFTGKGKNYLIVVLTDDNPSEQYGIDTIEDVARVIHRDLNAAKLPSPGARLAANVAQTPTASPGETGAAPSSSTPAPAVPAPPQPSR